MYRIYTTPALVSGSFDRMTADRTVQLFTREVGMIYAVVQGVRKECSKHRYALTEFSLLNVSLVQGKGGWRIVGVEPLGNLFTPLATREQRAFARNVIRFVKRMVRGEEAHSKLFDDVAMCLRDWTYTMSDLVRAEQEAQYLICMHLGYVPIADPSQYTDKELAAHITRAIYASQL
jgi:recombinational DNA repair protein (RecF pathway)